MVEKSWEEAISLFQNNPSHPSVLNTLCEVLLRETKPKIQIDLTEEEYSFIFLNLIVFFLSLSLFLSYLLFFYFKDSKIMNNEKFLDFIL